ncbi:MAG: hypothetical protein HQL13_06265, partial [Candidatus Omnitrophica bacterium]|nr:hypothetical protein [Candidatus Omnitrophota bacterium]
ISNRNITNANSTTSVNVTANNLLLQAAGSVGAAGLNQAINTNASYIENAATGHVTGAIYINAIDGVVLGDDSSANLRGLTSDNGPVYITANNVGDGTLTARKVTVNANAAITLITNDGQGGLNDIVVGAIITGTSAGGTVTLVSNNNITDEDSAATVDVTGYALRLQANGSVGTSGSNLNT